MRGEYSDDSNYQRMADLYSEEPVKHSGEYNKTFVIGNKEYTVSVIYDLVVNNEETEINSFDALIWDEDDVYYYDEYYIKKPEFTCISKENDNLVTELLKNAEEEITDNLS